MKRQPPRLAKQLLHRFCHVSYLEEVEGDLDEEFNERIEGKGLFLARIHYWIDIIRAISNGNRNGRTENVSRASMFDSFRHFQKIFFRNLMHNRSSAFINVGGLALSLMSFVVVYLYVVDELTYDAFHPDAENIYRISHSYKRWGDGLTEVDARAGGMWVLQLKENMPEIKECTRFSRFGYPGSVKYEKANLVFEEQQFFWADASYTDIFSLPMIAGEGAAVLRDPKNVIISETIAKKYFGNGDPIGQEIIYSRDGMDFNLVVAGIMKEYPSNAHFHPDFIANNAVLDPLWKRDGDDRVNNWGDAFTYSFIRVQPGTDPAVVSEELGRILSENIRDRDIPGPVLTKLTDIHFTHGMLVELEQPGERMYANISASIGVLILVIAGINYTNLATARSVRRAKEVGLRKTLGVRRSSLIGQFLGESFMLVGLSFILSLGLTTLMLPFFNEITGKSFELASLMSGRVLLILGSVAAMLSILAGGYPAFYLSKFKPGNVLKGVVTSSGGAETFRRTLVVFQFTITILLIVAAVVIHNQVSFIKSGKLAAQKDQIMTVRIPWFANKSEQATFRDVVLKDSRIETGSFSNHLPHQTNFGFLTLPFVVPSVSEETRSWERILCDEKFADLFELEFVAGRNFPAADTSNMILNEAAVKDLGLSLDDVVGREIFVNTRQFPFRGVVIGVVKDFPYRTVRTSVSPMVMISRYFDAGTINLKVSTTDFAGIIDHVERAWKQTFPGSPFKYWFMDQEFDRMYRQEIQMERLSNYFTGFTIAIACLGLFALASFTAEQKTKEIGIRKVLGASVSQIFILLTNRFVILVIVSYIIAIPLSVYAMNIWLEGFVYRAPMQGWMFVSAGIMILFLTYLTVGIESIRAASANPVESIKHE